MFIPTWLVILLVVGAIYFIFSQNRANQKGVKFYPFCVHIRMNWNALKELYSLDDDFLKAVDEKMSKTKDYNFLNYGLSFSVLRMGYDYELVFNNSEKYFSSEVDFEKLLFDFDDEFTDKHFQDMAKSVFRYKFWVKGGIEGYDLGIVTPESAKKSFMVGDKADRETVTTIPCSLFSLPKYRFGVADPKENIKKLEKHGWKINELHEDFKSDTIGTHSVELDHKYFTVTYDRI